MGSLRSVMQESISEVLDSLKTSRDASVRRSAGSDALDAHPLFQPKFPTVRPQKPLIRPDRARSTPSLRPKQAYEKPGEGRESRSDTALCKCRASFIVSARNAMSFVVAGLSIGTVVVARCRDAMCFYCCFVRRSAYA